MGDQSPVKQEDEGTSHSPSRSCCPHHLTGLVPLPVLGLSLHRVRWTMLTIYSAYSREVATSATLGPCGAASAIPSTLKVSIGLETETESSTLMRMISSSSSASLLISRAMLPAGWATLLVCSNR